MNFDPPRRYEASQTDHESITFSAHLSRRRSITAHRFKLVQKRVKQAIRISCGYYLSSLTAITDGPCSIGDATILRWRIRSQRFVGYEFIASFDGASDRNTSQFAIWCRLRILPNVATVFDTTQDAIYASVNGLT